MKHIVAPSISPSSSSSSSTSTARNRPRAPIAAIFSFSLASLSVLAGCPGTLEGNFPDAGSSMNGSGGSSSGSGGMTGSGGSGSGSGGSGSGGSGSGSGGMMAMGCDAPTKVFKPSCATGGCHDGKSYPPDLSSSNPASGLVGKAGTDCSGMKYLDTTKPATGLLLKKIMGSDCGSLMPFGGTMLSSELIQCVQDWATSVIP